MSAVRSNSTTTQFNWTEDVLFGFGQAVNKLPTGTAYPDGSGWLVWTCVLFPDTLDTRITGQAATVWNEFIAGTHDTRMQQFGQNVVRRMALTGHPLKRLIINPHREMNLNNTFQVFGEGAATDTRDLYKQAMEQAFDQIRAGADAYQAGAGSVFHFCHRPAYRDDIGALDSYCPDNVDCVGLSYHPGEEVTTRAQVTALQNGTLSGFNGYGIATDLPALANSLGTAGVPIIFPEWSPRFESGNLCPICDIVAEEFHAFLGTLGGNLICDCIWREAMLDPNAWEGGAGTGKTNWDEFVALRKVLWSDDEDGDGGGGGTTPAGWPYPQSTLYAKLNFNRALRRYGDTNDQWPCSVDASNRVLFVGSDGNGFGSDGGGGTDSGTARTEWRVSRVGATVPANNGTGLAGFADLNMRKDTADGADRSKPLGVLAFGAGTATTSRIAVWYQYTSDNTVTARRGRTHCDLSGNDGHGLGQSRRHRRVPVPRRHRRGSDRLGCFAAGARLCCGRRHR